MLQVRKLRHRGVHSLAAQLTCDTVSSSRAEPPPGPSMRPGLRRAAGSCCQPRMGPNGLDYRNEGSGSSILNLPSASGVSAWLTPMVCAAHTFMA